jgi:hypothetical protein
MDFNSQIIKRDAMFLQHFYNEIIYKIFMLQQQLNLMPRPAAYQPIALIISMIHRLYL